MRKLIVIGLFLNAALLAGRFWQELPARAAGRGGQGAGTACGDMNGDGAVDISDPIYLLAYLFNGGGAPVACAQEGGLTPEEKEILGHFSIVSLPTAAGSEPAKTLRLTGVNLQIVNGLEGTQTTNGSGNLIVGYEETRPAGAGVDDNVNFRTGSHNIVVGMKHNYTSYGGLVAGLENTVNGDFASISGGCTNTVTGSKASVSGGFLNSAAGGFASVSGGSLNEANGDISSVSGGFQRVSDGLYEWSAGSLNESE
jgi:hypothetical protein